MLSCQSIARYNHQIHTILCHLSVDNFRIVVLIFFLLLFEYMYSMHLIIFSCAFRIVALLLWLFDDDDDNDDNGNGIARDMTELRL